MKNLKSVVTTIALTVILSTSAMAGNIGGMRSNTDSADITGNIGGMRTEESVASQLSIFIKGNIGGMIVTILSLP